MDAKISSLDDLDSFFCDFEKQDESIWPLNVKDDYQIGYSKAWLTCDKFGFGKVLDLEAVYKKNSETYIVSEDIFLDLDKIEINLSSITRKGKKSDDGFVKSFIEKHYLFLKQWVHNTGSNPENAMITVEAHSGILNDVMTRGGYVWATYGFDFANMHELNQARICFKKFAEEKGVDIALKDLEYFKYPCHFAAFQCIKDGQKKDLGKEFLLQYSWRGQMSVAMSRKSEIYRYAKTYHNHSKKASQKELSRSFLKMMKRYMKPQKTKKSLLWLLKLKKQRC